MAAVLATSAAVVCVVTPWLVEPPLEVRLLAGLLTGLTWWAAARLAGAAAAGVREVLRGRARPAGLAAGMAAVLVLAGCGGAPASPPAAAPAWRPVVGAAPELPGGTPVRVRIGLGDAPTDEARARRAVEELVRGGGLTRSTLLIAVPTGSGWLDDDAVAALEELTGGDLATVTVQYAQHPSWVEYLRGTDRAARSATTLLGAVRAQLATLPAAERPRLLIFGESLGATAAAAAVTAVGDVDGCLLAGRPGSAGAAPVPGCTDVGNDDDPVTRWRPGLVVAPRGGLPWLPAVTFWQVTGALVGALDQPEGSGHRYGATLADDWARLGAEPPGGGPAPGPVGPLRAHSR
ncbi:alpha/beta hydrolase family protein [Blastococcus xanthinilyticus]|uniref:Alpha/beta hydrolase family protein n=1 Tax=Blastococcus xanthinilyticus TaxID=1564164 RepID=A0A5S5D7U0_9ACTN|nr:alpha/beta hydrolase family protein [Blastococcus xanthinilyticus]